jgi:CHASE2 domain-containing sensor protein
MRTSTFDLMQRNRLWASGPDPRLVIIDIDERSLAEMAGEFGRWPWPRDTLASVLAGAEAAGASAIVFDILFSDPDRNRPGGDRAFEAAVRASPHAWFPVVRLPPANDAASDAQLAELPGLAHADGSAAAPATAALILPFMSAILETRRLGTGTVYPDRDGVLRSFAWQERRGAWTIDSLPLVVARAQGASLAADATARPIVWRHRPNAYPRVSFVDAWRCAEAAARAGCFDLRDKIVVVGATAPSLHDLESSPLRANHAGADVLATLIDNALHDRAFATTTPAIRLASSLLALAAAVAWGRARPIRVATLIIPMLLILIGYASLHSERVYIDLAMPAAIAIAYLSAIRLYESLRGWFFRLRSPPPDGSWSVACVAPETRAEHFQWRVFDAAAERGWRVLSLVPIADSVVLPTWALVRIASHADAEAQAARFALADPTVWCAPYQVSAQFPACLYRALAERAAATAPVTS